MELAFSLVLPRDASTVPVVRRLCRGALLDLGVDGDCVADIELALTEACANVIAHVETGRAELPDQYEVTVAIDGARCEIRVIDQGSEFDTFALFAAEEGEGEGEHELAERGRGIHVMRSLVDRVQFEARPGSGTVVRLEKELAVDPDALLRQMAGSSSQS